MELISAPPLSPVPIPMKLFRDTEQSNALLREIMSLLDKGAIEELDPRSLSPGFYSRLFLVPKTDGSHRPVFDLKSLNQFVHKEKFKMTTPRTVTNAMHKGDWAVSIDLKDAYFHVPIHVRSRRLLRFAIATNDGLRVFEFRALPFGLTSAPRVFTKVILPLGHHAHLHAVCLLQYLDDWLLRSPNKSLLARQTSWLLDIIRRVGFVVNVAKSQLTPTQRLIHIGVEYYLDLGLMFPPMTRVRGQDIDTYVSADHDGLLFPVAPRTSELSNRCNPTRQVASQTSAAVFAKSLGTGLKGPQGPDPSEARPVGPSPSVVVGQEVHQSRNATGHSRGSDAPLYRRVRVGLGSPFGQTPSEWELVDEGGHSAHQSPRDAGGAVRPTRLPGAAERSHCSADVRQCLGSVLHTETGGNSFCASVPSHSGGTDPSTGCTDHSAGQAHSRGEERVSGSSLQNGQDSAHRMDPPPLCVRSTMHGMGHPQPGPVCNPPQQQASSVCVSHGRPTSRGCRCHVNVMEGNVCLCIPPICDAGASTRESLQGSSLRDYSSRPEMAQSVLVRQTVGTSSRLSFGPATEGRSTVPTTQPHEAPVTTSGVPTRLEAVKRSLQERGFSQAAADQIARGRRQSTRAVYDSKWRVFAGWCTGQSVDPFQVTIQKLADFFVYLFQVKHLNPRTIKGYRSAISSTISACGSRTEFSDSQELGSLIRSFQLERPPQRKIAPQWNLSLVLQSLLKPPFEPIAKCELKFLTLKTVFLVALVSGRRRSELHALCFDSHHFRQNQDQSMVTLYPDLDFVAKNQAFDAVAEPIKLSAFTSVGGGGQMLTGNYALSDVCFNTVSRLPHQSAGKDVRSCLFLTSLLNPMRSNVLRFPHGFVSSYA